MQELKGNIRVFCRVRPFITDGNVYGGSAISFPTSTDLVGRGIDLANQSMILEFTFPCWPSHYYASAVDTCVFILHNQLRNTHSRLIGYLAPTPCNKMYLLRFHSLCRVRLMAIRFFSLFIFSLFLQFLKSSFQRKTLEKII